MPDLTNNFDNEVLVNPEEEENKEAEVFDEDYGDLTLIEEQKASFVEMGQRELTPASVRV